mgnify:CR=1 FL=1
MISKPRERLFRPLGIDPYENISNEWCFLGACGNRNREAGRNQDQAEKDTEAGVSLPFVNVAVRG